MNLCSKAGNSSVPCVETFALCATGPAAGSMDYNWLCPLDVLPGSAPQGSGIYCFETSLQCLNGRNVRHLPRFPPMCSVVS